MYLFKNNATSILRQDTAAGSTTLTLPSGEGARFPAPVSPDLAQITIEDRRTGQLEICKMTARSTDVLTVVRAQEGTVALSFYAGATVSNRMTAGTLATIQARGTFFYAGPYNVPPVPGPGPGDFGDVGQVMPTPIPPGTQYFNTQNNTIYVWDGTAWISYTNMLPLDGHLAMIGNLQMGAHDILLQGGDIIGTAGSAITGASYDANVALNTLQLRRLTTNVAFPTSAAGELVVNISNGQLGVGPAAGGAGVALIGVRIFSTLATYAIGDHVINAGSLLRASVANGPGAFNGANWTSASGGLAEAPIDGNHYVRKDANWVTITTAGLVTEAPNNANEYVRKAAAWVIHDKSWAGITSKPATFPPDAHTHPISEVVGLQTSLDLKADQASLVAEINSRQTADTTLQGNINTNTTAISANATAISTETTNRIADVDAEEAARIAADNALTTAVNGKVGPDAPSDGKQYARKNATWTEVTGGALVSTTAPASPPASSFWFDSDSGSLYIRYDDGNSQQWVQVNYSPPVPGNFAIYAHRSGGGVLTPSLATWTQANIGTVATNVGGWTTSSGALVVPKTGVYQVSASACGSPIAATGQLFAGISINGANPGMYGRYQNTGSGGSTVSVGTSNVLALTAGNTIALHVYTTVATTSITDDAACTFLSAALVAVA